MAKNLLLFGDEFDPDANLLRNRFGAPPFSVLNARDGAWQERKRFWVGMGIQSELGRDSVKANTCENIKTANTDARRKMASGGTTASVFDPTLTELLVNWFSPQPGLVLDPFAGGSVRGIVTAKMGRRYWGCDLRREQVEANRKQADEICGVNQPAWVCGDSMSELESAPPADFVLTCPPYGDLERYSNDPRDLSTMEWHAFSAAYRKIIFRSLNKLKTDRFCCFVVGNFRDKQGYIRDFCGLTISAFLEQGAKLYNDAILLQPVNSLSLRAPKVFSASKKLLKCHQHVLIFVKGDWKRAVAAAAD